MRRARWNVRRRGKRPGPCANRRTRARWNGARRSGSVRRQLACRSSSMARSRGRGGFIRASPTVSGLKKLRDSTDVARALDRIGKRACGRRRPSTVASLEPRSRRAFSLASRAMATAALSLSSTARVAPTAPSRSKRSVARPVRARAVATKAEGEISGLSEDGQWQELCRAEIPGKLPRCAPEDWQTRPRARGAGSRGIEPVASRSRRLPIPPAPNRFYPKTRPRRPSASSVFLFRSRARVLAPAPPPPSPSLTLVPRRSPLQARLPPAAVPLLRDQLPGQRLGAVRQEDGG